MRCGEYEIQNRNTIQSKPNRECSTRWWWRLCRCLCCSNERYTLKMKNLFNNACTFRHKSFVIFSFFSSKQHDSPLVFWFSSRLSLHCDCACAMYMYVRNFCVYGVNTRVYSPPDDPFAPTQTLRIRLSPSIAAIHIQHFVSSFGAHIHRTHILVVVVDVVGILANWTSMRFTTQLTVRCEYVQRTCACMLYVTKTRRP